MNVLDNPCIILVANLRLPTGTGQPLLTFVPYSVGPTVTNSINCVWFYQNGSDNRKFKELMEMMIEKQNKDIEEKLGDKLEDVKKEMSGAIKVVTDRQDKMETDQLEMKDQLGLLRAQMEDIKKIAVVSVQQQADKPQQQPEQPQQRGDQHQSTASYSDVLQSSSQPRLPLPDFLPSDAGERRKALDLLDLGRRTVSLHPFKQSDIDYELKRGANDPNEAKLWAVQTYLRYEMNIKSHVVYLYY